MASGEKIYLNNKNLEDHSLWEKRGLKVPEYDRSRMIAHTKNQPSWLHIGPGNIFRGYIAALQENLLNKGIENVGIIAASLNGPEEIEKFYTPYDNLAIQVIMNSDNTLNTTVVGSIAESIYYSPEKDEMWGRFVDVFESPSLKMVSFTMTEKGYATRDFNGNFTESLLEDMGKGPGNNKNNMAILGSLLYTRYKAGKLPLSLVSMDNFSHNGDVLKNAITTIVEKWVGDGKVENEFLDYIRNTDLIGFPCSTIDKITPRPSSRVATYLEDLGLELGGLTVAHTGTYGAPFVNTEKAEYLVIEDWFPNGKVKLDEAGVFYTTREIVNDFEKMKVCTCLNPLHTALALYGCLLGYSSIAEEMEDTELRKLVNKLAEEGMKVVVTPEIISPEEFLKEVLEERLPNKNIPDAPQRIATDTSQKMAIRFGETIKSYLNDENLNASNLIVVPLVIAGWFRYLLGVDDQNKKMELSSDPLLQELRSYMDGITVGSNSKVHANLEPILSNEVIFGVNLYDVGLGEKVEEIFEELIVDKGAVRATLKKYL